MKQSEMPAVLEETTNPFDVIQPYDSESGLQYKSDSPNLHDEDIQGYAKQRQMQEENLMRNPKKGYVFPKGKKIMQTQKT